MPLRRVEHNRRYFKHFVVLGLIFVLILIFSFSGSKKGSSTQNGSKNFPIVSISPPADNESKVDVFDNFDKILEFNDDDFDAIVDPALRDNVMKLQKLLRERELAEKHGAAPRDGLEEELLQVLQQIRGPDYS